MQFAATNSTLEGFPKPSRDTALTRTEVPMPDDHPNAVLARTLGAVLRSLALTSLDGNDLVNTCKYK